MRFVSDQVFIFTSFIEMELTSYLIQENEIYWYRIPMNIRQSLRFINIYDSHLRYNICAPFLLPHCFYGTSIKGFVCRSNNRFP